MKDLTKIIKVGQTYWSTVLGECRVVDILNNKDFSIVISVKGGIVYLTTYGEYYMGTGVCTLFPSKDELSWENYNEPIPDKAFVEAWDDNNMCMRVLGFYDAENKSLFDFDGTRFGEQFDYYRPVPDADWTEEARERLKL